MMKSTLQFAFALGLVCLSIQVTAQSAASAVFSDFGGYWTSSSSSISATEPNNRHHLIGFTMDGVTYSTGVSDSTLDAQTVTYTAAEFSAVVVPTLPLTGSGFYQVMQGAAIDGDGAGIGSFTTPATEAGVASYLTDGTRGLDLGTGIANIPNGSFNFALPIIDSTAINDGAPDVLFTQMGVPSLSTADSIVFVNVSGVAVGDTVAVDWNGIASVGNWEADFWKVTDGSNAGANLSKSIRVIGYDLQAFSITAANAADVFGIKIIWNGASDPAFVALNDAAFRGCSDDFTFSSILPLPASGAATPDGGVNPTISGGTSPYGLIVGGDTLASTSWNSLRSGTYLVQALDAHDCASDTTLRVVVPYSKCN